MCLYACILALTTLSGADGTAGHTPVPIFDGATFEGWEGNLDWFRIEDGAIVGGTLEKRIPQNEFLCTTASYGDFELTVTFRLKGQDPNAGIQFRTTRIPNSHEVSGYQADMGQGYWGCLYDESRRKTVLVQADPSVIEKVVRKNDWNTYRIRCEGNHIQLWLNDVKTVDFTEKEASVDRDGIIALQIHSGEPSEAWYKDIQIEELPKGAKE